MESKFKEILHSLISLIRKHPRANLTQSAIVAIAYLYYRSGFNNPGQLYHEIDEWIYTQYFDKELLDQLYNKLDSYDLSSDKKKQFALWTIDDDTFYRNEDGYYEATNSNIADLVYGLLELKDNDTVLDVGSGKGDALAQIYERASAEDVNINLLGIENNYNRLIISKIRFDLLDKEANIINGDVLSENCVLPQYDKGYCFPTFGGRIINPNFSTVISSNYPDLFNGKSDAEWMFAFKMLNNMNTDGKSVLLAPTGLLYRYAGRKVHEYLINNGLLEGVILLPAAAIRRISVKTALIILSNDNTGLKIVDASGMTTTVENREFSAFDASELLHEYYSKDVKYVDYDAIIENDYVINPVEYLDSAKPVVPYAVPLSSVVSIDKGSQYTVAKFKDVISRKATDYQILTSGDIEPGGLVDYSKLTYINGDKKLLKFALKENDIVITTKSTRVKTFIAKDLPSRNIIVTGGMIILHPDTDKIDPTFLKMFLDSETGSSLLASIMRGSVIKTIPFHSFQKIEVSCPPMDKQLEYSKKYNRLIAMYEGVKEQLEDIQQEINGFYETQIKGEE